ncbi:MAG: glycoside-pentoside-hexuronide (GPH):cation symporter [Propionibacteriaceae bacterium]|nr:glycoside-pentoside-hexuronide (GPH):cation symporter [Propionibacteriaceae bacterium]
MSGDVAEKKYLKWYNKVGYGSGDIAGNVVYAFLSAFVMIYLTDSMGMQAGVVATLMMLSRFFDGFSDFVFGVLMDKTRTRMGKARPWMFWAFFGCAAMIVAVFAIPPSLGMTAKYVWFFIAYTLLNSVFYTANNIAYSALTALVTKNVNERVQMGSIRFVFAFGTSLAIQAVTVEAVRMMGGGAEGWRAVAIVYALIGLASNTLAVFSVKELSVDQLTDGRPETIESRPPIRESLRLVVRNKYFILLVVMFITMQLYGALTGMGIYFMTYVLGNPDLLGQFAAAINIPQMVALIALPLIVARARGMYRVNLWGYVIAVAARIGVIIAGYMVNVPLMLVFTAIASLTIAPVQGTLTALIAETSEYTFLKSGKRIDGLMFSCTSLGTKLGGGIGTALTGWLLEASGYVSSTTGGGDTVTQPQSVIDMLHVTYLWLPMLACVLILVLVSRLDVEKQNKLLREAAVAEQQA